MRRGPRACRGKLEPLALEFAGQQNFAHEVAPPAAGPNKDLRKMD
jgi:hypothetical protein